tara:strand:- start:62 stop:286 length:225 start_codon:yes stop_codon:yes gene_type:complete
MKEDRIERFLKTLLNLTGVVAIVYIFMIVSSCDDNIYIGGYNKDFEEISELIFETDSLIMTIQKDLDSLNAKGY